MLWIFSLSQSIVNPMPTRIRFLIPLIIVMLSTAALGQDSAIQVGGNPDVSYRTYTVNSPAGQVTVYMVLTRMEGVREGRVSVECAMGGSLAGRTASPAIMTRSRR
jgi:hypothetical protein